MMARSRGGSHWLDNALCDVSAITVAGKVLPITQPVRVWPRDELTQTYVLNPRSAWIDYAREEALRQVLPHLASGLRPAAKVAASCVMRPWSCLLHASGLDKAVVIGNHLISTNLYPDWQQSELAAMRDELTVRYPKSPLLIRNVCPNVNPALADGLQKTGWTLIPARMVYLCDPHQASVWKHNHVKQDARLLASGGIEILRPDQLSADELPQLRALYRQLFIDKHSRLNPDFSAAFFELCLETGFLDLYGLRLQGKLAGVLGLYEQAESGWLTTPLIGYDTSLPQEKGIYRCLMALLLQQARERKLRLHYSSGASQFKRARGGIASLEYSAVFSQHLATTQRLAKRLFARSMQTLAPAILRKADGL